MKAAGRRAGRPSSWRNRLWLFLANFVLFYARAQTANSQLSIKMTAPLNSATPIS